MDLSCPEWGILVLKKNLNRHLLKHQDNKGEKCFLCDKDFKTKNSLLPRFIREKKGLMNKILRLEQEGERLHSEYNNIENSYKSIYNRATRFWLMIENYENKLYATKWQQIKIYV